MKRNSPSLFLPLFFLAGCSTHNLEPRDCSTSEANEVTAIQGVFSAMRSDGRLPRYEGARDVVDAILAAVVNQDIYCSDVSDEDLSEAEGYTDGELVVLGELEVKSSRSIKLDSDFDCHFSGEFSVERFQQVKTFTSYLSLYHEEAFRSFPTYGLCYGMYIPTASTLSHEFQHIELEKRHSRKSRRLDRKIVRAEKRGKDEKVDDLNKEKDEEFECDSIYVNDEKVEKRMTRFFKDLTSGYAGDSVVEEVDACVVTFDDSEYEKTKDALWYWLGNKYEECRTPDCIEEAMDKYVLWMDELSAEKEEAYDDHRQECIDEMGRSLFAPIQEFYTPNVYEGFGFL